MNRTVFIIDGFNLYHSLREAAKLSGDRGTKWLNVRTLCESYLQLAGGNATLKNVYYFSALARHLEATDPGVTRRHRSLLDCLRSTGVRIELSRFKPKTIRCEHCGHTITRHEEKETDVAIAARLLESFHLDECDTVIIVSGDSDLAPAVRTAQKLYPEKTIGFAFPYRRKSNELVQLTPLSFKINRKQYLKHQFPPTVEISGRTIHKPLDW